MNTFFRGGLALTALAFSMSAFSQDFVSGEALVKFKSAEISPTALTKANATLKNVIPGLNWAVVRFGAGTSVANGIALLKTHPNVETAEPNYRYQAARIPDDPLFGQLYGMVQMRAPQAWDKSLGSANVTVAVLDTGTKLDHPDLAAKIVPGFDFVDNDNDPNDESGHGTHVSGTVGASWNNGMGVAGVAPLAKIMPLRVLGPAGGTSEGIALAVKYAADNGAKIVNMSLGGGGAAQVMRDAIVYALNKGTLSFAASGNNGVTTKFYPAGFPECVAVGATNQGDTRAGFSNYGADWVDIAAPGQGILSTTIDGAYGFSDGTSMACPHAAGAAALILGAAPSLTAAQLRQRIESTCDPVGNWVAFGRVNLDRAVVVGSGATFNWGPAAISMLEGVSTTGNVTQVTTSDNRYFTINSKAVLRLGQVSSAQMTFRPNRQASTLTGLKVKVELGAVANTTANFFVFNNLTGKYDYFAADTMTGSDRVKEISLPANAAKYFNGNNELVALVRVIDPSSMGRAPRNFTARFDLASLSGFPAN